MPTRPYRPEDRERAIAALGVRSVDQATHHIHVGDAGPDAGIALWVEPGPGGEPYLGAITLPSPDRALFYELARASAQDALDRGYTHASFTLQDAALLALIERDFDVEAEPSAWDGGTGEAVQWEVRVDLRDALNQLGSVLDG